MIDPYRIELDAANLPLSKGAKGPAVRRVQEWLGLRGTGVAIDGDFGDATERALKDSGIGQNGQVDQAAWSALTGPLAAATGAAAPVATFGEAVVHHAQAHLAQAPREIGGDNKGPWVRHYCRGFEVAWCQGFVSTIWGQAALGLRFDPPLALVLDGIWCLFVPRMVQEARAKGRSIDGRNGGVLPTAGSMFFVRGGEFGYLHVGIVESTGANGTMTTIEGNTNDDGSANGYEVARRVRRISSSDFGAA